MSEKMVTIEIDGKEFQAVPGTMLIDVADAAGIPIPRFCYHKKLSVAANCRMCLVEVERAPKPLPACATPVNEGMKVKTRSPLAIEAQKSTMEFLLINHPLDCPICDQGGECELQDVAMRYGADVSRYTEGKRVVLDKDIGPLISTDLTRCIQCTRCIRFGAEIAGIRELGATGRGEYMQIGMYIEGSVNSELSGNIIDVCPVGALTSKPFRFRARAWELVQKDGIAPHDSVGSNVHFHLNNGEIVRVVPKENESVNECWISDRDRYSYEGIYSDDRLKKPLIKKDGVWAEVEWQEALEFAANGLKKATASGGDHLASLVSPAATIEELYLVKKLLQGLGCDNVDYRLRQADFRSGQPDIPWLGMSIEDIEQLEVVLVVGANPRHDQPLLGHRLRKAAINGAQIYYINPIELDLNYTATQWVSSPAEMLDQLAAVGKGMNLRRGMINKTKAAAQHKKLAGALKKAKKTAVLMGPMALAHPDASMLWGLASAVAEASESTLGFLPEAANSVGAAQLFDAEKNGNVNEFLSNGRKAYLLHNLEPEFDCLNPALAHAALKNAEIVVALTGFRSDGLDAVADVQLPIGVFGETSGTYVNASGEWQSFAGVATPQGEARPAWKVLRVLGNSLGLEGFEYVTSEAVLSEARDSVADRSPSNQVKVDVNEERLLDASVLSRIGDMPLYATDALVRRASSLQKTILATKASIRINAAMAEKSGVADGDRAKVTQNDRGVELLVEIDPRVPDNAVRVQSGLAGTEHLAGSFAEITLEKA